MEILEFIKTHNNILTDTLAKLENDELQPNEYLGNKTPLITSYGYILENVIFSMAGRFGESVLEETYAGCISDNGFDDLIDKAHFCLYEMEDCKIYMTVYEQDDNCVFHYVLRGEEAAREIYSNEIEAIVNDILVLVDE